MYNGKRGSDRGVVKINLKRTSRLLLAVVCMLAAIHITSVIFETEETRLKRTIYKAKRLTERENIVGLTNYISIDYSDELGNDRRSLLLIAKNFFDEYKNILILIDALDITVKEEKAFAHIKAMVYWQEKSSEDIISDAAEVEANFKKEGNNWRLIELKFFEPEKKNLFHPMIG